jgi:hypothetical protein
MAQWYSADLLKPIQEEAAGHLTKQGLFPYAH